jgi:hypothetical protein
MKLVAIYHIFDGIELLEGSLKQIYSLCYRIILHYQTISNSGELCREVSEFIDYIHEKYPKTIPIRYDPHPKISALKNEMNKRRLGIKLSRQIKASHFLLIDCDEYYITREFARAIDVIDSNKYDSTACRLYTYYKLPTYRLTPIENYYVPFIHSIDLNLTHDYHVYVDPTRKAMGNHFYEFKQSELMMHHFSWVRKDIAKKLRNSSANVNWYEKIPMMVVEFENFHLDNQITYFPGHSVIEVGNIFRVELK